MAHYYSTIDTPFDTFAAIVDDDGAVTDFNFHVDIEALESRARRDTARLAQVQRQIDAFFARRLETFDLVLRPTGTPFQLRVWEALRGIPFGHTISYQELARRVGDPRAAQAVGQANNRNPIPLIIPCHRVIGKNGAMVGFGGGLALKQQLLAFETPLLL